MGVSVGVSNRGTGGCVSGCVQQRYRWVCPTGGPPTPDFGAFLPVEGPHIHP